MALSEKRSRHCYARSFIVMGSFKPATSDGGVSAAVWANGCGHSSLRGLLLVAFVRPMRNTNPKTILRMFFAPALAKRNFSQVGTLQRDHRGGGKHDYVFHSFVWLIRSGEVLNDAHTAASACAIDRMPPKIAARCDCALHRLIERARQPRET